jgi:hypothetical protein
MQEEEPAERMKYGAFARTESLRSLPCLEEELQEPLLNLLPRPRSVYGTVSGDGYRYYFIYVILNLCCHFVLIIFRIFKFKFRCFLYDLSNDSEIHFRL